jgi:hypothetical protein
MAALLFKWLSAASLCFVLAGRGAGKGETHPLYITVTDIKHNPKDKILEISCKIFTNDFESVLEKMAKKHVDLSAAADKAASGRLIEQYVGRHLSLKVDGKPVALHFVGSENENDGTWSYFQVNDISSVKRIDVVDELLYDGFSQQINILQVTVGGERKSTKLDCPAANATFEF